MKLFVELSFISQKQLDTILAIKDEAKKRFILDHNEVPKIVEAKDYEKQIEDLKRENLELRNKIKKLLSNR